MFLQNTQFLMIASVSLPVCCQKILIFQFTCYKVLIGLKKGPLKNKRFR